ncbi:hypothetical protein HY57_06730 [Dyella japonica A8]|uniref:TonB-dependent receptor-like beta-barrel domain-containing protein n=2 Tax=Dyella japonica TaxID=231455 RepID=A0A075K490_9GAMM|nr:hypothetical protein HY57_06730 [Dyella japonica A8]
MGTAADASVGRPGNDHARVSRGDTNLMDPTCHVDHTATAEPFHAYENAPTRTLNLGFKL